MIMPQNFAPLPIAALYFDAIMHMLSSIVSVPKAKRHFDYISKAHFAKPISPFVSMV
jgi:hypothetical protein